MRFAALPLLLVPLLSLAHANASLNFGPAKRILAEPRFGFMSSRHLFGRQNQCTNNGAQQCEQGGCCDAGKECCGLESCCITGNFCCGNFGIGSCAPDGGVCCADGNYCEKGQSCKTQGTTIICAGATSVPTSSSGLDFTQTSTSRSSTASHLSKTSRPTPELTLSEIPSQSTDAGGGSSRMRAGPEVVGLVAGLAGVVVIL